MAAIYLDHNSTTAVLPEVVEAMRPYQSVTFGNPASAHQFGRRARQALESARERVAELLDAQPDEVLFTSGATEANNLAIFGLAGIGPFAIIASPIEHPSIAEPLQELKRRGADLRFLPVDAPGKVLAADIKQLLGEQVSLVTCMLVNNETGAVQPVAELCELTNAECGPAAFHCDAVQAVGKMPVSFRQLGVSTLSLSAHKFGGPRGVGALMIRRNQRLKPVIRGGHQQKGLRPGTEAVDLAVGLATGLELACKSLASRAAHVALLRQTFLAQLKATASPMVVNGPEDALPYALNISFPGCRADALLMKLDLADVACSTGSACSSGSLLPSPTLRAMGCGEEVLTSAMRFSFSWTQSRAEILEAAGRISEAVRHCRNGAE
jgi:cysteine desulfurase